MLCSYPFLLAGVLYAGVVCCLAVMSNAIHLCMFWPNPFSLLYTCLGADVRENSTFVGFLLLSPIFSCVIFLIVNNVYCDFMLLTFVFFASYCELYLTNFLD